MNQGNLSRLRDKIAGCDLLFQRLELSEDRSASLGQLTWQQLQRDIFIPVPPSRDKAANLPVPFFWLPKGNQTPASWPQGLDVIEPETRTLEEARCSAVGRARAEHRRRGLKGRHRAPITVACIPPVPWLDLLIVSSDKDFDCYNELLFWIEQNNKVLQQEHKKVVSYSAVLGETPLIEFEEFNGTIIDPWDNSLICRAVLQIYGYCSADDINKRQSHWLSLVQSPGAIAHKEALHGIYTAEFDPPPKQRRSTNLRYHRSVRINQQELLDIMQILITL
ncbi:MAG: hypothetical protein EOP06_07860 [Proteobacteria bacterium]|nr:MAG: hypothetical protein EOP06_07860 [Pseudomonadota bacterium]